MTNIKTLVAALAIAALTGCTFNLSTTRHNVAEDSPQGNRVAVRISDANLGGGEQAYVNASVVAQLKAGAPGAVMAAAGENLSIDVELLPASLLRGRTWYTILSLGVVKLYYQLGSVRVVNADTGKILAIHEIVLSGRRISVLGLEEYQTLVLPEVVKLVTGEMATQGLAEGPIQIDVSEDLLAME